MAVIIERLLVKRAFGVRLPAIVRGLANRERLYWLLLVLALAGVVARAIVIGISFGSNDMRTWDYFARFIDQYGLWEAYRRIPMFNHPPLMGLMAVALKNISEWSEIPFRVCWKVPPLVGDLFAMWLLWRHFAGRGALWAAAAVAMFSVNPVSIAVTAFHGNTDSLVGLFALYAAILHGRRQFVGAGFALAAAVNVKVIALIYVPGYLLLCAGPLLGLRFALGLALGSMPIALALLKVPAAFAANVFAYNSQLYPWGVNAVAMYSYSGSRAVYSLLTVEYRAAGKLIILVLTLALACVAQIRRWTALRLGAATMALFLFLAPGFGVQYLVWLVPLLAACSLRYSAFWGGLAGTFLLSTYQYYLVEEWPLRSRHFFRIIEPLIAPEEPMGMLGILAWIVLGRYLYVELVRAFDTSATPASSAKTIADDSKSSCARVEAPRGAGQA